MQYKGRNVHEHIFTSERMTCKENLVGGHPKVAHGLQRLIEVRNQVTGIREVEEEGANEADPQLEGRGCLYGLAWKERFCLLSVNSYHVDVDALIT